MYHVNNNTLILLKWKKSPNSKNLQKQELNLRWNLGFKRLWHIKVDFSTGRFFNGNKCTIMIEDVGDEEGSTCVGTGCIWKTSVPFSKFWFEPITSQKTYLNKKKLKSERKYKLN